MDRISHLYVLTGWVRAPSSARPLASMRAWHAVLGRVSKPTTAMWRVAIAAVACSDLHYLSAAIPTASGSTLFSCGSMDDAIKDSNEVVNLFQAVKSICCEDLQEQCTANSPMPTTCATAGCARVVEIVAQSCAAASEHGWVSTLLKPIDQTAALCSDAEVQRGPTYVISDPQTVDVTTCRGLVTDGAGSEYSGDDVDAVVFRAPAGLQLQLTVETLYLSAPTQRITIYDGETSDDTQQCMLQGTALPTTRQFTSTNGVLRVMRARDHDYDAGQPLLFGLSIGCACPMDGADLCGEHVTCVDGRCVDGPCFGVHCGEHGRCDGGQCVCNGEWSGDTCELEPCVNHGFNCGRHGECKNDGDEHLCHCDDGWSGDSCDDPCVDVYCGEHGHCNSYSGQCVCDGDWSGDTCADEPCVKHNCGRHGECKDDGDKHLCNCDDGWSGDSCALPRAYVIAGIDDSDFDGQYDITSYKCQGKPVYVKSHWSLFGSYDVLLYQPPQFDASGSMYDFWEPWHLAMAEGPLDNATTCPKDPLHWAYAAEGDCVDSPDGVGCVGKWAVKEDNDEAGPGGFSYFISPSITVTPIE
eukprot:COSAG02_NODE_350_length_24063_cov_47.131447_23_plen_582_part_00